MHWRGGGRGGVGGRENTKSNGERGTRETHRGIWLCVDEAQGAEGLEKDRGQEEDGKG